MKASYTFTPHWIGELIQYDDFCKAVAKVWDEVYPDAFSKLYENIEDFMLTLDKAWVMNSNRWDEDPTQTAQVKADKAVNAIARNVEWFNQHLPVSQYATAITSPINTTNETLRVYNLQGMYLGQYDSIASALSSLSKGIYIINGKKVAIR